MKKSLKTLNEIVIIQVIVYLKELFKLILMTINQLDSIILNKVMTN